MESEPLQEPRTAQQYAEAIVSAMVASNLIDPLQNAYGYDADGLRVWVASFEVTAADLTYLEEYLEPESVGLLVTVLYHEEAKGYWLVSGQEGTISRVFKMPDEQVMSDRFEEAEKYLQGGGERE